MRTQIETHHRFVDYKADFDGPIRDRAYAPMSELGISAKADKTVQNYAE